MSDKGKAAAITTFLSLLYFGIAAAFGVTAVQTANPAYLVASAIWTALGVAVGMCGD